jgi:cell division transport system permease protein
MGARWRYLLSEVGIGLRRNPLMIIATVVTVTVSLALLGAGLLVQRQVDLARSLFYSQVEVSIFLLDDIGESQRLSLEQDLVEQPGGRRQVIYESKEDAYEQAQEIFAVTTRFCGTATPDFLPASFRVGLHDPEQYDVIESQYLAGYPGVEISATSRVPRAVLLDHGRVPQRGAGDRTCIQLIAAAALISNTIRITAFARREQIGIMKLVGATNWYIRLPFVLEGVIAGLVGGLAAGLLLLVGYRTVIADLRTTVQFMPFIRLEHVVAVIPLLLLLGALIAAGAAFLSLRRFLSV